MYTYIHINKCFTLNSFNLNNPIINFILEIIIAFENLTQILFVFTNEHKLR